MRTVLLGCLLLLAACHRHPTVESGGIKVYAHVWEKTKNELRFRAGPDLDCSPYELEFTLAAKEGKIPTSVYAEGCGRGALYSRLLRRHGPMAKHTDVNTVWERMN
jgi:hypothetical protein